jgi:hypothetical protein
VAVFNRRLWLLPVLALISLWASGCSDFVDATQPDNSAGLSGPVTVTQTVGQTFVARHAGLNGIQVWLARQGPPGEGIAVLHLRDDPLSGQDLAQARLSLTRVSGSNYYTFSFPVVRETLGKRFYFWVEAERLPEGSMLKFGRGPGKSYGDGAMYRSGQPTDRQLAFRLCYARTEILTSLLVGALDGSQVLLVTLTLFVLPGWALLTYLLPGRRLAWSTKLGLAAGLSLCVYPLLLLWSRAIGVQPGKLAAWGTVAAATIALIWRHRHAVRWRAHWHTTLLARARSLDLLPTLTFVLAALVVLGSRLFVIRGYQIPLWGDSVQHAAISQLIVDQGGLFDSWLPYTPFKTLTVHFGFHSDVAAVHALMGGTIPYNTLVTGQIVNFLSILTLVPLANRLIQNRWTGTGVLLLAGLLSPMPAEYVNWGRYSQLAGQVILPVAAWLTWDMAETEARHAWRMLGLVAIAMAGMFLSYYRMPHYYAAFVVAWLVAYGLPRWQLDWRSWGTWAVRLMASGMAMLVLVAPWLARLASARLAAAVEAGMATGSTLDQVRQQYAAWRDILTYVSPTLMTLAGAGLVWCAMRRRQRAAAVTIGLWAIGLTSLVATRLLRLPGSSHIDSYAIMISLYMPVGLLGGYWIDSVLAWLERFGRWGNIVAICGVVTIALLGGKDQSAIINPAYRLVAPADLAAMNWIRTNTLDDARFLVDGFLIYNGASVVGSDAGWWIPLLASRQNTMPPQYALIDEEPYQPDYGQAVVNLVTQLRQVGVTTSEGMRLLCQQGVTHVYIGQGQGQIAIPPPEPMLSLKDLESSPHFKTIYRQDKVGIWAFDTESCPSSDRR